MLETRRVAVLSLHTSPLAQPGTGDSGGMNVYVRELASALAEAGIDTRVYVRRWDDDLPVTVEVEPGFRVVHVPAGPTDLTKEQLELVAVVTGSKQHGLVFECYSLFAVMENLVDNKVSLFGLVP